MQFLLDENVPRKVAGWLRARGHEVTTLNELHRLGIKNGQVAKIASESCAVVVTCDSDFLSLRKELQQESRILYIKDHPRTTRAVLDALEHHFDFIQENLRDPGKVIISLTDRVFESAE